MKREIDCLDCAKAWERIPDYVGEGRRTRRGELLHEATCDGCGSPLAAGTKVAAVTLWVGSQDHQPGPWESEHLKPGWS